MSGERGKLVPIGAAVSGLDKRVPKDLLSSLVTKAALARFETRLVRWIVGTAGVAVVVLRFLLG